MIRMIHLGSAITVSWPRTSGDDPFVRTLQADTD